jgi:hypothetical protein
VYCAQLRGSTRLIRQIFINVGNSGLYSARTGEKRNVYRLLVGKPEGKRPLGRPKRMWIDNIKIDLLEIGISVVYWIGLAQDRYRWRALVYSVMNPRIP